MYGKLIIRAKIKVLTGMHIGGSTAFSAIGAVDSPVIRDARTGWPIIPGSSIKGKLRTLLARSIAKDVKLQNHNDDDIKIKRLFGATAPEIIKSRLQFADALLSNSEELENIGLTEVKIENTISRATSTAMPRHIERVVSGSQFNFFVVYDLEKQDEIMEDISNIASAVKLLQLDYLGGHGTRGYGRVSFSDFDVEAIDNCIKQEDLKQIIDTFKEVEDYALLSI